MILLFTVSFVNAQRTASVTGNWSSTATWGGQSVPTSTDAVIINTGKTVTVECNAVCASITINAPTTNNGIIISGTNTLTVSGTITMNSPSTGTITSTIDVGAGTLSAASIDIPGSATAGRFCTVSVSTGTITTAGNITFSGTAAQARLTFSDAGTLNIEGTLSTGGTFTASTGTVNCNGGAQTVAPYTYNNITLSNSGVKTFATIPTVNGVLSLEGDATIVVTTGVVTYGANATLQYNTATNRTVTSEEWITPFAAIGGIIIANVGEITLNANKVLNTSVPLTINSGATLNTDAANDRSLSFGGDFHNNGGTFTTNASPIIISGTMATQSIDGFTTTGLVSMTKTSGTATFTDNVNGTDLTINGTGGTLNLGVGLTHVFTGTWTRTAGTLNGGSSILEIDGDKSGTGGTFTAGTGTVKYNASGAQSCAAVTYNNLTLLNAGVKTFATTPTVNNILSLEGTATVVVTSGVVTYGANATLQYNTATSRTTTSEEWITPFAATGGIIIANVGEITLNANKVLSTSVPLIINSGATLNTDAANNRSLSFGGEFHNNGGTFTTNASPIIISGTMASQSIEGFTTTGLVSMTKTGGTATFTSNVNGGAGLTVNGTGGTLNLGVGLTHVFTGTWKRTAGTLDGGSSFLEIAGSISGTGGTFTAGTGTVEYNAAVAQTCAVVTYNNLTLSNAGVKTFATTPTVNNILSLEGSATVVVTTGVVTYGTNATLQYNTATSRTATLEEWISPFSATGGVIIANTGKITLNADKVFNASVPLTINNGATLATANKTLTFGGDFNNNGTFTAGSSPIIIANNMAAQSIDGFTTTGLVSMTKTNGTATFTGNVNSNGLTVNGSGATLNMGISLTHNFSGICTITAGVVSGGSSLIEIDGNVNGTSGLFSGGSSSVILNGNTLQTISGSETIIFNNLTLSNSAGVTLNNDINITGTLQLSAGSGDFDIQNNKIDLGTTGTLTGETATSHIKTTGTGTINTTQTSFSMGAHNNVAGLGIDIIASTNFGATTIKRGHCELQGTGSYTANHSILRYFEISPTSKTANYGQVTVHYFSDELNGLTDGQLVIYQSVQYGIPVFWTPLLTTNSSPTASATTVTNNLSNIKITLGSSSKPLPVELINFSSNCNNNAIELNWQTASEINNDYFVLEKSYDAVHFLPIDTINGAGNSNTLLNYYYKDINIKKNVTTYYKLHQVDFDGTSKYSDLVESSCQGNFEPQIIIAPNPSFEGTQIQIVGEYTNYTVTDMLGQFVDCKVYDHIITGLKAGIYIITFDELTKIKFIVNQL